MGFDTTKFMLTYLHRDPKHHNRIFKLTDTGGHKQDGKIIKFEPDILSDDQINSDKTEATHTQNFQVMIIKDCKFRNVFDLNNLSTLE